MRITRLQLAWISERNLNPFKSIMLCFKYGIFMHKKDSPNWLTIKHFIGYCKSIDLASNIPDDIFNVIMGYYGNKQVLATI